METTRTEQLTRALQPTVLVTERERAMLKAAGLIPVDGLTYRGKVSL